LSTTSASTAGPKSGPKTLADAIDVIEEAYEFMLAYAAQGRSREEDDAGSGIRERLMRAEAALTIIASAGAEEVAKGQARGATAEFFEVVKQDAARARAAFRFVTAQSAVGSQIIDNLNASTHVRTLLTDLFLLDEALKISGI
jgi:hypothetical protein